MSASVVGTLLPNPTSYLAGNFEPAVASMETVVTGTADAVMESVDSEEVKVPLKIEDKDEEKQEVVSEEV
jgi:hypothetical protein